MSITKDLTFKRRDKLPLWNIILHPGPPNDSISDMIKKIMECTRLKEIVAQEKVYEATEQGKSILLTTHKERAELILDQLLSHQLCVTLIPD
jgi:hypothetical protein